MQAVAKVQLAAQTGNVGVERAGVTARAVIAPDGFVQVIPVQRLAAVAQKQKQQVIFLAGQVHFLLTAQHTAGRSVNRILPHCVDGGAAPGAPQHTFHPGYKLSRGKRLDDVIIRAAVQPAHPLCHGVLGCDEDAGRARGPNVRQQIVPIQMGHHHIEQHQIIAVLFQQICRRAAVGHGLTAVARLRQDAPYQHGNSGFVVHNQNRLHSTIPLYNPYCTTECYISVNF